MGSGDVPLYCSVVNKKFCIPALSCYFCSSLKKIIASAELLQERRLMHRKSLALTFYIAGGRLNLLNFLSVCLASRHVASLPFSCRVSSSPVSPVTVLVWGFFLLLFLTSPAVAVPETAL